MYGLYPYRTGISFTFYGFGPVIHVLKQLSAPYQSKVYQALPLVLLCLLLLFAQGTKAVHAADSGLAPEAVAMHCDGNDLDDCHSSAVADCCDDQLLQCALDCAQGTAWLPATLKQLHLKQVRALPPPLPIQLPDPLTELPYQPPRRTYFV